MRQLHFTPLKSLQFRKFLLFYIVPFSKISLCEIVLFCLIFSVKVCSCSVVNSVKGYYCHKKLLRQRVCFSHLLLRLLKVFQCSFWVWLYIPCMVFNRVYLPPPLLQDCSFISAFCEYYIVQNCVSY